MSRFWPIQEVGQSEYEHLRHQAISAVLAEHLYLATTRFERFGLAGLILKPSVDALLACSVVGAERPRWTGHDDPRLEALAATFGLLTHGAENGGFSPLVGWTGTAGRGRG